MLAPGDQERAQQPSGLLLRDLWRRRLVGLGLEFVRPIEVAARRQEQDEPERDEHAEERVELGDARQQQRQDGQREADAVDDEDRLTVRQARGPAAGGGCASGPG